MNITYFHQDIKVFFNSLEKGTRAKMSRLVELLEVRGPHLGMPYSKKLEKNLYELRVISNQNVRIFYTFHERRVVLLHACYKKTQKLAKGDLETARRRLSFLYLL